jgi:Ca2+:H+ antiporter
MFVGGLGRESQRFSRRSAGNATIMLFLAVVALIMPAVFDLTVFGSLAEHPPALFRLGFWTSVLLVIAYIGGLIYTFTMQRDPFRTEPPESGILGARSAVVLLAIATVVITVQAELLVAGLDPVFATFGISELFSGVIIVALVGGAAESYSAVRAARHDRMTLATEIAIGSSAQIALFIAPVLVFTSFGLGNPMTLLFHPLEIVGIALSVVATAIVALDGESNWVEGLQLLAVYVVLAVAFYLMPVRP